MNVLASAAVPVPAAARGLTHRPTVIVSASRSAAGIVSANGSAALGRALPTRTSSTPRRLLWGYGHRTTTTPIRPCGVRSAVGSGVTVSVSSSIPWRQHPGLGEHRRRSAVKTRVFGLFGRKAAAAAAEASLLAANAAAEEAAATTAMAAAEAAAQAAAEAATEVAVETAAVAAAEAAAEAAAGGVIVAIREAVAAAIAALVAGVATAKCVVLTQCTALAATANGSVAAIITAIAIAKGAVLAQYAALATAVSGTGVAVVAAIMAAKSAVLAQYTAVVTAISGSIAGIVAAVVTHYTAVVTAVSGAHSHVHATISSSPFTLPLAVALAAALLVAGAWTVRQQLRARQGSAGVGNSAVPEVKSSNQNVGGSSEPRRDAVLVLGATGRTGREVGRCA